LLVVGVSGAGKSSLARAGLLPRLTTPGVVPSADLWRVAVMRPSDRLEGPIASLAVALMQSAEDLQKEEEGRGPALPEIAEGDSKTPAELAAQLAHADPQAAIKPVLNALDRLGARQKERERRQNAQGCSLVLLVDQLDEIFAASVGAPAREKFVALLGALAATGRTWVDATLRADLYELLLKEPGLKDLKENGASHDLAAPGPVEMAPRDDVGNASRSSSRNQSPLPSNRPVSASKPVGEVGGIGRRQPPKTAVNRKIFSL
jgi:hypothetical protein